MREAIALRADHTGDELRKLARASDDANQTRRLLALASIYDDGSRSAFASSRRGRATMHKTRTPLRILRERFINGLRRRGARSAQARRGGVMAGHVGGAFRPTVPRWPAGQGWVRRTHPTWCRYS